MKMKKRIISICALCLLSLFFIKCKVKSEIEETTTSTTTSEEFYFPPPDVNPVFPGGDKELFCFIENNIDKDLLKSVDTVGRSFIQFTVDTLGQIKEVKVLKTLTRELDAELIRLVESMPSWQPGVVQNEVVERQMILPFKIPYENKCLK